MTIRIPVFDSRIDFTGFKWGYPYIYTLKIKNQNLMPSDAKFEVLILLRRNLRNMTFVILIFVLCHDRISV